MTSSRTEPSVGEKKAESALRAVLLGAGLWLAPFSLVQNGAWAGVVVVLGLALVLVIASVSRFPSAAALWMARRSSERHLAFWSVWFSCGGLLTSVLVAALPAVGIAAGIPVPWAFWTVIGGGAVSALINLVVLVRNIAAKPGP